MIPYRADVPMERWPIANFTLIGSVLICFVLQFSMSDKTIEIMVLNGFRVRGLFGHLFLHADIGHVLGNMLFLWVFGNAVCAKFNNVTYVPLYLLLGLGAGVSHLMVDGNPAIGASGAVNGIVGSFFVLYPLNEISCFAWFFGPRFFSVSSIWMILLWLGFDIWGAMSGTGGIAYFAHIGGFLTGSIVTIAALKTNVISMRQGEISLLDYIQNRGIPRETFDGSGLSSHQPTTENAAPLGPESVERVPVQEERQLRFACPRCGVKISASSRLAGKQAKCPKCNSTFRIATISTESRTKNT